MDRRKYTRIAIKLSVKIEPEHGEMIEGTTRNISFGGAMVDMAAVPCPLQPGDKCRLFLILSSENNLQIELFSRVVHKVIHIDGESVGFEYISVEGLDAFQHFKNMMVLNSQDPDQVLQELEKEPVVHSE